MYCVYCVWTTYGCVYPLKDLGATPPATGPSPPGLSFLSPSPVAPLPYPFLSSPPLPVKVAVMWCLEALFASRQP